MKYSLKFVVDDEHGKRLRRRAPINVKRRLKTIKTDSGSKLLLKKGTYRIHPRRIVDGSVPYEPKRTKIKIKLKKNRTVWIPYKRMPMIPSRPIGIYSVMMDAVNEFRAQHGVKPLTYSQTLANVAQQHASDLCRVHSASHFSSDGSTFEQRVGRSAYQGDPAGEVIAMGTPDIASTILAWKSSPEHYKALIHPNFNHMGIGFDSKREEGYTLPINWWVIDFGYDPAL